MHSLRLAEGLHLFEDLPDAATRQAALRLHLAGLVGCAPDDLVIERDARGKPRLAGPASRLFFNVSRRARLMLVGTAWDRAVGVDLELVGTALEPVLGSEAGTGAEAVASAFFAPGEVDWLGSLPQAARSIAFLRLWTAKEAALKAIGLGIGGGMREPDLSSGLAAGRIPEWRPTGVQIGGNRYGLEWFSPATADGETCVARALALDASVRPSRASS